MGRVLVGLEFGAVLAIVAVAGHVQACSIDGKPTLTVNGVAVSINTAQPTSPQTLRVWAPFVLSSVLRTGRGEALAETVKALPLTPEAYKVPWRWDFGDGTLPARGTAVRHVFHHPGVYKITVSAYYPSHKIWYAFDAVQLRVVGT